MERQAEVEAQLVRIKVPGRASTDPTALGERGPEGWILDWTPDDTSAVVYDVTSESGIGGS